MRQDFFPVVKWTGLDLLWYASECRGGSPAVADRATAAGVPQRAGPRESRGVRLRAAPARGLRTLTPEPGPLFNLRRGLLRWCRDAQVAIVVGTFQKIVSPELTVAGRETWTTAVFDL